ncbi:hypothetical protein D1872_310110 [compost metagenome]
MNGRRSPRRSAQQRGNRAIGGAHHLRAELKRSFTAFHGIFNHLDALAGDDQLPIFALGARDKLAQFIHTLLFGQHQLLDEVFRQCHFLHASRQHRQEVMRLYGSDEIEHGARF